MSLSKTSLPGAELGLEEEDRMRVAPEANDVTDRFEDIDQLLLWGAQDTRHEQEKHFPRPCCRAHFQLCHNSVRLTIKEKKDKRTKDHLTHDE